MKKIILISTILLMLLSSSCRKNSDDTDYPEYIFTYAENQSFEHPATKGAYKFAELVKEKTNGRIEIEVEHSASLGNEDEIVEQLQFGGIDFTRACIASISDSMPKLNVLYMPFLYRDSEHEWAVLDGPIGQTFLDDFQEKNMIGLSWYDAGARNIYTTDDPVTCLEDMSNMKIRALDSSLVRDVLSSLGSNPIGLQFKDVYSAMQTGEVNGAENNLPSYESMKHYEIAKYYTLTEHLRIPEVQLCALSTWNRLSQEDQQIIRECAYESALYERELWVTQEERIKNQLSDYGVIVIHLTDEELQLFKEATTPLYRKYCEDYLDLLDEISQYDK